MERHNLSDFQHHTERNSSGYQSLCNKGFVFISLIIAVVESASLLSAQSGPVYNVGYMVLDLQYQQKGLQKKLTVAVWYPTMENPRNYQYGGPTWGRIAINAKPVTNAEKFPFLAFSHGFGGSGLASVFFTEALASHGWIVACPDHHDSRSLSRSEIGRVEKPDVKGTINAAKEITSSTPQERDKYLYRPEELKTVIEIMLSTPLFGECIDTNRIAVGGHSFGGFTSLALCGALPEYYDPRIKALLMFSTGAAGYLFTEEELARVKIPSMLYMGGRERKQKRGDKTMEELSQTIYRNMPVPKYYLEVRGANHFSFNVRLSEGVGSRALSGNEKEFDVITRYSVAFLEKYVAAKQGEDEILNRKDKMLTKLVSSTEKSPDEPDNN
jgi:predicted dienelactone hydrolase